MALTPTTIHRRPGIELLLARICKKHPHWPMRLCEHEAKLEWAEMTPAQREALKREAEKRS